MRPSKISSVKPTSKIEQKMYRKRLKAARLKTVQRKAFGGSK